MTYLNIGLACILDALNFKKCLNLKILMIIMFLKRVVKELAISKFRFVFFKKKKVSILICVISEKVLIDLCVTNQSHSYKQINYCKTASKNLFLNKLKIIKDIKKLRKTEFLNQLKVNKKGAFFFKLKLIKTLL